MIEFTIHSQIRGGKNHIGITRTGRRYPLKAWAKWRDQVVGDLRFYLDQTKHQIITEPCKMTVKYSSGDRRRRDVPALMDSLFHCFERAELVADDSLFRSVGWWDCGYDKKDPRVTVRIEPL